MTAALEVGEWSAAHPGRTLPPVKTRYPFYRRLGGSQGRSVHSTIRVRKSYKTRGMHIMKICKEISHRWWKLGLWLRSRNKFPVFTMGNKSPHSDSTEHGKFCQTWKLWWLFFYCEGVIRHEFLNRDQMLKKKAYFMMVIERLWNAVRRKMGSDLWSGGKKKNWLLHHANAPVNSSVMIRDFLIQHETTPFPQRP